MSRHRLLLVDDEENVLRALRRTFLDENYDIETASGGQDGLEMLSHGKFTIIISDQRMPEMQGVDLLARVRERWPDVVRMMLTGYTEMDVAVEAINRGDLPPDRPRPHSEPGEPSLVDCHQGAVPRVNQQVGDS